jgi:hypothetical protein
VSNDSRIQKRVFRLEEGVRAVIPEAELHNLKLVHYGIKATVRYEQWPIVVLLVALLALVAMIVGFFLLARKPAGFTVESDAGGEQTLYLPLFAAGTMDSGGRIALSIRNCGLLLLATATGRIVRGRFLPMGGGEIAVAPAGSKPRPLRPSPWRRKGGNDDSDFGDAGDAGADYVETPSGDADAGTIVFTVRPIARDGQQEDSKDETF